MSGLAILAKQLGHKVTGSDSNVYPPMSTQLKYHGIALIEGYCPSQLKPKPDCVIVGNALSRGNPAVEAMLDQGLCYTSGPQWLAEHILQDRWVLGCAGTHGKTTTTSMLTWILEDAGLQPGYLIGGIANNFGHSARLGHSPFFVIESDEYDSAFFDKRSKFLHYRPRTLILNNLEFDHADIFDDLAAIQRQCHHLIRTIPNHGRIIYPADDANIETVLQQGLWSETSTIGFNTATSTDWHAELLQDDGSAFNVYHNNQPAGAVHWSHIGEHNVRNAIAAIVAAQHVGVQPTVSCEALQRFAGIKRRMEHLATINGIAIYDDFAHHPTAIATTLKGLRAKVGKQSITAIIEPASNTMRLGAYKNQLAQATHCANHVFWYQPSNLTWHLQKFVGSSHHKVNCESSIDSIVEKVVNHAKEGDHIVIMSNSHFGGIQKRLMNKIHQTLERHPSGPE